MNPRTYYCHQHNVCHSDKINHPAASGRGIVGSFNLYATSGGELDPKKLNLYNRRACVIDINQVYLKNTAIYV
jgi:hypothetical protein